LYVDHIDGNRKNNTRENLRVCTNSDNLCYRGVDSKNTSGFKGVSWCKRYNKWRVRVVKNCVEYHGGYYDSKVDAAEAYNNLAKKIHGEFAWLNEIPNTNTSK
jgi:hypothetical protein